MTNTKQFIEDAIEGGWKTKSFLYHTTIDEEKGRVLLSYKNESFDGVEKWKDVFAVEKALLDPLAWQAVEKHYDSSASNAIILARAKHHAGIFMSNLMEGGSIEDVLKQLYENRTRKNKG